MAKLYHFTPFDSATAPYPMNVYQAWQAAEQSIKRVDEHTSLFILSDEHHAATLTTFVQLPIEIDRYFASLQPFDRLLQARGHRHQVYLLSSVFAYLAGIHRIPFFNDDYTYLSHYYEIMLEEAYWGDRRPDTEMVGQIMSATSRTNKIKSFLHRPDHLSEFAQRLTRFLPKRQLDRDLLEAAGDLEHLFRDYPSRCIFESIPRNIIHYEDQDEDTPPPFAPEQYLQFIWTKFDDLGESILQWIENDNQELANIEQPINWQIFDKPQLTITLSLDFEKRFFDSFIKFIIYLNQIE